MTRAGRRAVATRTHGIPDWLDPRAATALLTRLPVGAEAGATRPGATGAGSFGIVGAALGSVAALPLFAIGPLAPLAAGFAAVAVLALVSGALHLDGLADTADALVAPTPEAAERARLDPRAGPAGVVALVVALGLDAALLAGLLATAGGPLAAAAIMVAAATSRAAAALVPALPVGFRPGLGDWFAAAGTTVAWVPAAVALASCLALSSVLGFALDRPLPLAVASGSVLAAASALALARLRHGLDGDAIGAIVELTFAATLGATLAVAAG